MIVRSLVVGSSEQLAPFPQPLSPKGQGERLPLAMKRANRDPFPKGARGAVTKYYLTGTQEAFPQRGKGSGFAQYCVFGIWDV